MDPLNAPTTPRFVYNAAPTLARFHADESFVRGVRGPIGCVSADTEFLTPQGWVRIDQYRPGMLVLQWDGGTGVASWVEPDEYIDLPCMEMWRFSNDHSLSMVLSDEHRMPLYQWNGALTVKLAADVARHPSRHVVPTTFVPTTPGMPLSDAALRVMVAVNGDGHMHKRGLPGRCTIAVRKQRKKDRLEKLLNAAGIEFSARCSASRPTEMHYSFSAPLTTKRFEGIWWDANVHQLAVILDEMSHWDGLFEGPDTRYYTTVKADADFIQYAAHATGGRGSICVQKPPAQHAGWSDTYVVHVARPGSPKATVGLRGDSTRVERVTPSDGRKYCFTVPTGFFVARHADRVFITGNSGKSTAMCMEILSRALQQKRGPDGVARTRWAVFRNTYPELKSTTIKTWTDWVKEEWYGPVVYSSPIIHKVWLKKDVYLEVLFASFDNLEDVRKLLSLEITGGWMNEARELPKELLDGLTGRAGRYPAMKDGGATWRGVIMDTNPPDDMHWWYGLAEEDTPNGYSFYAQPSGTSPEAENRANLDADYYERQIPGKSKEWINVYVHGKYGVVKEGKPVYEDDWADDWHVSQDELVAIPGRGIVLGWDYGLTPACVICQIAPSGQFRVLEEIVGDNIGIERFIAHYVKPVLQTKYRTNPIEGSYGDPGSGRTETDEHTVYLAQESAGIPTEKAGSNALLPRLTAVRYFLGLSHGGRPGFLVNKTCKHLRRGFNSGYSYKRMQVSGAVARYAVTPSKNIFSHVHDALQYVCMGVRPDAPMATSTSQSKQLTAAQRQTHAPADAVLGF